MPVAEAGKFRVDKSQKTESVVAQSAYIAQVNPENPDDLQLAWLSVVASP